MKKILLFSNENRNKLLKELENSPKKFVELKKRLNLESNLLAYNLNILLKEGIIKKEGLNFLLTNKGKYEVAYLPKHSDISKIPLPVVVVILKKGEKVGVRKKTSEPDKGKISFISSKLNQGESILEKAKEISMRIANIEIKNPKLICINNYIIINKEVQTHYIIFFIKATPIGEPKNIFWENCKTTKQQMVPDNKFILSEMINNKLVKVIDSTFNEKTRKFKVVRVY